MAFTGPDFSLSDSFDTLKPKARDFGSLYVAAEKLTKPKVNGRVRPIPKFMDEPVCAAAKPGKIFTATGITGSPVKTLGSDELHARILLQLDLRAKTIDNVINLTESEKLIPPPVHALYKRSPLDPEIKSLAGLFLNYLNELIKERCANKSSIFGQAVFTLGCATIINNGKLTLLFGISGKLTDQSKKSIDKRNALLDLIKVSLNSPETQDQIHNTFPITAEYNSLDICFVVSTSEIFSTLVAEKAPDYGMSNPSYCFEKFVLKFVIGLINNKSIAPEDYRGLTAIGVMMKESLASDKSAIQVKLSDKSIHYVQIFLQLIDQCDNCKHPASLELLFGMLINKIMLSPYAQKRLLKTLQAKNLTLEELQKRPPKFINNFFKGMLPDLFKPTTVEEPEIKLIISPEIAHSGTSLVFPAPSPDLKIGSPLISRHGITLSPGMSPIVDQTDPSHENSETCSSTKDVSSVFKDEKLTKTAGSSDFTNGFSVINDTPTQHKITPFPSVMSPIAGSFRFFAAVSKSDQEAAEKLAALVPKIEQKKLQKSLKLMNYQKQNKPSQCN